MPLPYCNNGIRVVYKTGTMVLRTYLSIMPISVQPDSLEKLGYRPHLVIVWLKTMFTLIPLPLLNKQPLLLVFSGLGLDWQRGKFSTTNQAYYNRVEGNQVIRMPNWLVNSRLAYDFLYAKVLYIQAGLEMHYRSGYYADAYNPMYQTFYLNNSFEVPASLTVDAFAVLRINRVRLFFKMSNVTNKIIQQGYYTSPYYPAIGRTFGFGVNWPLFD
jgi:hypothetical protein